jgi:hypothetical protein
MQGKFHLSADKTFYNTPSYPSCMKIFWKIRSTYGLNTTKKRAKGQVKFRGYHSTVYHFVNIMIIIEECFNNKTNLLCCFIDFRKKNDTMPRTNLWNRLEERKVPFEIRDVVVRLYENVIDNFRNTEGW